MLLSKSAIRQMQQKRVRVGGKKVVTDDIRKLKSLKMEPELPLDRINYYREPIEIEYYIPRESRFQTEIKYLYIELFDPQPKNPTQEKLFRFFKEQNKCYNIVDIMNTFPEYIIPILESYENKMPLLESLSIQLNAAYSEDPLGFRRALYIVETLRHFEPTYASLTLLGDYITFSLNYLIRKLNELDIEFYLEDSTVAYLIKLEEMEYEASGAEFSERHEILKEIFFQKAFPHRGLELLEEDERLSVS